MMAGYAPEYFEGLGGGGGPSLTPDQLTALDRLYAMTDAVPAFTESALGNVPAATPVDKQLIRDALNGKWETIYGPRLVYNWQVTDYDTPTPSPGGDFISDLE